MAKAAIESPWKSDAERRTERALKREAVLAAAAHVFAENGYHRASLDEVARVLNVTKPTLYYYFKNKEAMLFACVQHGLDMLEAAGGAAEGDGMARLVAYLEGYAAVIETDFGRCAVRISDSELSEASRKKVRRIKSEIDRKIRQLVTDGIDDGSIASSDPKITAFALAGALNSIGQWHRQEGVPADKKLVGEYIHLLLNGLAPRRGRAS